MQLLRLLTEAVAIYLPVVAVPLTQRIFTTTFDICATVVDHAFPLNAPANSGRLISLIRPWHLRNNRALKLGNGHLIIRRLVQIGLDMCCNFVCLLEIGLCLVGFDLRWLQTPTLRHIQVVAAVILSELLLLC